MSIFEPSRSAWTGRMLSIQRIVAGFLFAMAGTTILFQLPAEPIAHAAPPANVGGRNATGRVSTPSTMLAGEMAVAYFQFHFPQSFFPSVNGGIPAVLFCFLFLNLTFVGAGPWSIDAMICRRTSTNTARGESD